MKTMFKSKSIASALAAVLFLSAFGLFGAVTPAFAQRQRITKPFPAGAGQSVDATFKAPGTSPVSVSVTLKNNGRIGVDPAKSFTVVLTSPTGASTPYTNNPVLVNPGASKTISLSGTAAGGSSCRDWKVTVSNPGDNATAADGEVVVEAQAAPIPKVTSIGPFGLVQSQEVEKTFAAPLEGDLTITATWVTDELAGLLNNNYQLSFSLYRPGLSSRIEYDGGFAQNVVAPNVNDSNKLKITHRVTADELSASGSWKIKVKGASEGKVKDIKITILNIPKCPTN